MLPPMTSGSARAADRITAGLFTAHALGSAGVIATATVAAIVGAELSGRTALAGLPGAAFQIGSAVTALLVGLMIERFGRRGGLTLAALLGTGGMGFAVFAAVAGSFPALLIGLAVAGTANAAVRFGRFTAAEIHPVSRRGKAVAVVVMGGTVGSVAGPLLVAPSGALTLAWGWGELAGPYLATMAIFATTTLVFVASLWPEPRELAARLEGESPLPRVPEGRLRTVRELWDDPGVVTAMGTLILSQAVMIMVMGMTSLHMRDHTHPLTSISVVFAGHTLGMYAFSLLSGWATDRFGRLQVAGVGAVLLIAACLLAPLSPALVPVFVSLFVLGFGWNLCYVAGSALLTDRLRVGEKSRIQGFNDLLMGGVSAAATLGGGVVYAVYGFPVMTVAAAVAASFLLALVWRHRRSATAVLNA